MRKSVTQPTTGIAAMLSNNTAPLPSSTTALVANGQKKSATQLQMLQSITKTYPKSHMVDKFIHNIVMELTGRINVPVVPQLEEKQHGTLIKYLQSHRDTGMFLNIQINICFSVYRQLLGRMEDDAETAVVLKTLGLVKKYIASVRKIIARFTIFNSTCQAFKCCKIFLLVWNSC